MLRTRLVRYLLASAAMALLLAVTARANQPTNVVPGGPYSGIAGRPVTFDASATTDPDPGEVLTFYWLFEATPTFDVDNPPAATGAVASHKFMDPGTYTVKLFVTDSDNNLFTAEAQVVVAPETYVGDDEVCGFCHSEIYDTYIRSGHPYKLTKIGGEEPAPGTWPHTPTPPLPDGLQWQDVSYVIGNFFWKTRFVDQQGYIHTGHNVQWNIPKEDENFDGEWVDYDASEPPGTKPYNCGRCHTTGYDPNNNQDGLPGLIGTWAQPGVRCEACHGPAGEHLAGNKKENHPTGGKDCSDCHYRDADFRMPWKGGFMRHHQQGEDFAHSPHRNALDCVTCHDPHKSVVYDEGGTITECTDCHAKEDHQISIPGMQDLECIDCHMPKMGKSARSYNDHRADIRSHLVRIMTDPIAAADNTYEADGQTFWKQEENGDAFITLDYACLGCHADFDPDFTLEEAAEHAKGIHENGTPEPEGDQWLIKLPLIGGEFNVSFEEFAGVLLVTTKVDADDPGTFGIGMEMDNLIFWMDVTGTMYFGNINHAQGTMNGIVFGPGQLGSIFLGEQQ